MRLSADRTMDGLKGGGIAVKTPPTKSAARPAQDSSNECGHYRMPSRVHPSRRINFLSTKKNRTSSMRGAAVGVGPLMGRIGGVDSVHTFGFGLGRTSVGSGRIRHVSGSSQCLQGLECSSSPTSGTVDPLVRGVFALTCVQSLGGVPLTLVRGLWPGRRGAYAGVWGGGVGSWLVGPPPAVMGLGASSFPFCLVGRWVANSYSWFGVAGTT
jgi:hypothetical protein